MPFFNEGLNLGFFSFTNELNKRIAPTGIVSMDLEVGYGKKKRIIKKKVDLNRLGTSKPNSKKAKEFIEQAKKL